MVALQSLEDLKNWDTFRTLTKEHLKLLAPTGDRLWVSRVDVDFEIRGKTWAGRAFLVGDKGELAMKRLKKEGLLFLEGSCRLDGKVLHVEGITGSVAKKAQLTMRKLVIGFEIVPEKDAQEDADRPTDAHGGAPRSSPAAEETRRPGRAAGTSRELQRELRRLAPLVREALAAATPERRAELQRLLQALRMLAERGDEERAREALRRLHAALDEPGASAPGEPAGVSAAEARRFQRRMRTLVTRLQQGLGNPPPKTIGPLQAALVRAGRARDLAKQGDLAAANVELDAVEETLDRVDASPRELGAPPR